MKTRVALTLLKLWIVWSHIISNLHFAVLVKLTQTVTTARGEEFSYDYLVNATGPYLNFEGTPGLGPAAGNTFSICTDSHAVEAGNNIS